MTVNGAWPLATDKASAVAPLAAFVLVICNALPATADAFSVVCVLLVFDTFSRKFLAAP